MSGRRNRRAFFGTDGICERHEGRGMGLLEKFRSGLFDDGWREGTENFAVFDAAVEHVLHRGTARVCENASISERSWTPFHGALEPSHDLALCNMTGGCSQQ